LNKSLGDEIEQGSNIWYWVVDWVGMILVCARCEGYDIEVQYIILSYHCCCE
jgi:hypothetical protein